MKSMQLIAHRFVAFGAVFLSAGVAVGQPNAPTPASETETDEETVILSPFEVLASSDVGYTATETLAGTRIRTDLRDVGSAISIVTREFLNDVGATDNSTLLQYTPNAEVAGTRGTYAGLGNGSSLDETGNLRAPGGITNRVRGLAAADTTRDFFVTDIPWDSYNVDRIDIQRGPNSILFGLGSPAGIINAQIRNPDFTNRGELQARYGSHGSWRTSLDYNREIIPGTLAVRFDGLWDREEFQQEPAFEYDKRYFGAIRYDPQLFRQPGWHTSIKAKYEHGEIDANRPRIIPPTDQISAWFRPRAVSADNPFGGMGKEPMNNPYDPWRTDSIVAGDHRGQIQSATVNFQPYLFAPPNQQQPFWLMDGATGQLYRAIGGYINNGGRNSSGGFTGVSAGIPNKRTGDQFYGVNGLANAAKAANLPNSQYGVYRDESLQDPTIFDFYNTLIDGPNKSEFEKWDASNIDITQTAFNDRLGIQLSYDRQKYRRGGDALFNNTPGITIDILQNLQDYYLSVNDTNPNVPLTAVTNTNYGRPYVIATSGGGGNSYQSDRKYSRASLFGELRAADFTRNDFLVKLLGKHRFNGVYSQEDYLTENRTWNNLANSRDWAGYWNGNSGNTSPITDRPPQAYIYLGSSIADRASPAGANIPGLAVPINVPDANLYVMDSTWTNFGVGFGDPWPVPAGLQRVYNGVPATGSTANLTQASNPANYKGWGASFPMTLMRYNDGADLSLLRRAQMSLRKTESYAASWQGYLWNDAIIPTIGWRHDKVKNKQVSAAEVPSNRSILNLQPSVYRLPDAFPANQIFEDDSTTYGGVVHVNRLFGDRDPLPLNLSLSYSKSSNFQITDLRRNIYGTPLENPTGETKDYGVLLSTKDGRFSFRAVKYDTKMFNANSGLTDPTGIGAVVRQGLRWRNVFLYDLSAYEWADRERSQGRNAWSSQTVHPNGSAAGAVDVSPAEGRRREDLAIKTWTEIQAWLTPNGYFQAWGFTPQSLAVLTKSDGTYLDRTTYEATLPRNAQGFVPEGANPAAQYIPDPASTVTAYGSSTPQGFTVTADIESKGYEFELTANPLPNWRIAFNASRTQAIRSNVGGPVLDEFIDFLDTKFANPDAHSSATEVTEHGIGDFSWAAIMPQFGNASLNLYANVYGPWRANYVAMKLQEGSDAPEIRKWRYNVITNYTFTSGFLDNVGVGASYRWQDKIIIGYPVIAGGLYDLTQPYFGPSEDALDLWVSYERKLSEKIDWKIQLNVRNALDDDGVIPISVQPDGQTWASVRTKPVQEWFVTNTFSF